MPNRLVAPAFRASRRSLLALGTNFAAFRLDERGNMAILGACAMLACGMAVGVCVDFSRATAANDMFQNACDAGAVHAVILRKNGGEGNDGPQSLSDYQRDAEKVFLSNLDENARAMVTAKRVEFTNGGKGAKCTYSAQVPMAFGSFVTSEPMGVSGEAVAAMPGAGGKLTADIHILMDTSQSMGVAADGGERDRMRAGIKDDPTMGDPDRGMTGVDPNFAQKGAGFEGCAFACHTPRGNTWYFGVGQFAPGGQYVENWWSKPSTTSTYQWARTNNIRLRIDVAKSAVGQVLDDAAQANSAEKADVQFSLSTFNDSYNSLTSGGSFPLKPTDKVGDIKALLAFVEIGYPNKLNPLGETVAAQPNTKPDSLEGFELFAQEVDEWKASGEAKNRQQYVILVTDGVRSVVHGTISSGDVRPFDQSDCDKIKRVARLAVLYTKYLEPEAKGDTIMARQVGGIYPLIEPNMRACASDPSLFAMADSSTEITAALKFLFKNIQAEADAGNLRLTQ